MNKLSWKRVTAYGRNRPFSKHKSMKTCRFEESQIRLYWNFVTYKATFNFQAFPSSPLLVGSNHRSIERSCHARSRLFPTKFRLRLTRLRSCHFLTCREHAVTRVDRSKFSNELARRRLRAQENRKKHEVAPCARVKELSSARHWSLQESKSYLLKRLRTAPGSGSREYGGQSVAPGASARKKALIRSRGRFCALPSLAALPPSQP